MITKVTKEDLSACARFAAVAARHGERTALVCEGRRLTYADLDAASSLIATQLRRAGVRRGDVVGLIARRSIEAAAAILGILKAGGAYLPLDTSYPPDLLGRICRDGDPRLVLIDEAMSGEVDAARFWSGAVRRIRLPDGLLDAGSGEALDAFDEGERPAGPDDLAYVMYTSGSTGIPKGVMVPHRGIVRLVSDCNYARLGPDETILHLAPLTFDASTFELWGALLNGGRLAILSHPQPSLDQIAEAIRVHGATTLWLTAGLFHLMVESRLEGLRPLRQLLTGGDVLSPAHVAKALAALPDCRIVNGYGPTENTTFTCCYPIPKDWPSTQPIPIGFPIQGTTVHVLDADGRPVADGEEGELYAGGAGVALGYLNQPLLNAEKFVADPFAPGGRLYRTGDRVRRRTDGAIAFLGRVDRQIKLNGKRVELDAVEAELRAEPSVADAAVIASGDLAGRRSIIAFVTPQGVDPRALQASLRARLPDSMIPAAIRTLPALPLSANGKVDRARLADLAARAEAAPLAEAVAGGGTQDRLRAIVARILGREAIDVDDNFFDLGASSLDIVRIHADAVDAFGPGLTVVDLFAHPNVKAAAARIDGEVGRAPALLSSVERARGRATALKRARLAAAGRAEA